MQHATPEERPGAPVQGVDGGAAPLRRPPYERAHLLRLLHPDSVALVGASARPGSFGQRVLGNMAHYRGRLHLVGRAGTIDGRPVHAGLAELPEAPDAVVVAVARDAAEGVLSDAIRAGAGGMVLFASGFAETGIPERAALQRRLVDRAREAGMPLIGPNTIGLANYALDCFPTFSATSRPPPGTVLPPHAIGVVSQSGALGFALGQAVERGVAISHVLTAGNSADVDVADLVAFLAEDPNCGAVACALEGTPDPLRLVEAARRAWRADKPLVVFKMASGQQGAAAALSHTGSLAGADAVWRAALAAEGAVVVDGFEALLPTASLLAKAPRTPAGPGVAVAATSGGAGIMAADAAERHGVLLPQPAPETTAVLLGRIPEFGSARNPCDVTAQVLTDPGSLRDCLGALAADPAYGALVVPTVFSYAASADRLGAMSELVARTGRVACNVLLAERPEGPGAAETERDPHLALFRSMDGCFAALSAWWGRAARRAAEAAAPPDPGRLSPPGARERVAALLRGAGPVLSERDSKAVLALHGVRVAADRLAADEDAAVSAAESLGFPVVLKAESPDIPHKSDAGVVLLGLRDAAAVRAGFRTITRRAAALPHRPRLDGVQVARMVPPGLEVVVGGRADPLFGPLVLVGLGGVLVELLADTAVMPAPVTPARAELMLRSLRGARLLDGFRGAPAVDVPTLARVVALVSELMADQAGLIRELDVNPLICAGTEVVAVDGLIGLPPG